MITGLPPLIIAIDGHSSTGKSTFAVAIAEELNYTYIDSGAMYRAITLFAIRENLILEEMVDEKKLAEHLEGISIGFKKSGSGKRAEMHLNGENVEQEIRSLRVSRKVSIISKIGFVRKKMVKFQRDLGKDRSVVMDGRDIGTVVFPDADIKIFMTADPVVRADRRYNELKSKGIQTTPIEVEHNVRERDYIDQNREESPLRKADDAYVLDNTYMTPVDQMIWFRELLNKKFNLSRA